MKGNIKRVREIEQRLAQRAGSLNEQSLPTLDKFSGLAERLEAPWQHPETDARLRKRIVRSLIHEVVVDVDAATSEIVLVIHWEGGLHTEVRDARRRRGQNATDTAGETVDAVRALTRICPGHLHRQCAQPERQAHRWRYFWTRERVTALRSHRGIWAFSAKRRADDGWMNLTEAARAIGVSARALRLAVEHGQARLGR